MDWINSNALAALAIGLFLGYFIGKSTAHQSPEQIKLRQQNLDELIGGLSTTQRSQIDIELKKNRKISAIKIFRRATNAGLKDANDAVTQMMRPN